MHNALAVAKIKSLEQLMYIEPHIEVVEFRIQATKVDVVDVLENERRGFTLPFQQEKKKRANVSDSSEKRACI